jgi:hypothetical protein
VGEWDDDLHAERMRLSEEGALLLAELAVAEARCDWDAVRGITHRIRDHTHRQQAFTTRALTHAEARLVRGYRRKP